MFIGWEGVNYPIIKKPEIERTEWKLNELSKYGNKNLDTPQGFYTRDTFLYSSISKHLTSLSVYWSDLSAPLRTSVHWFATYIDYLPQRYVHSMNKSFDLDCGNLKFLVYEPLADLSEALR